MKLHASNCYVIGLLILNAIPSFAASCYNPAGGEGNATITYQCPTTGNSQHSMCCFASGTAGAHGPDKCVKAGPTDGDWLCQNDDNTLWRRGCSDKNWDSPGCLKICAGDDKDRNQNTMRDWDEPVTKCSDGSYCCGSPNDGPGFGTDCCNQGKGVWVFNGTVSSTKPSNATDNGSPSEGSHSSNHLSGGSPITSSSSTSDAQPQENNTALAPSANVIAGAVAGSLGALLLLGVGQFFLIKRIMERREQRRVGLVMAPAKGVSELSQDSHVYEAGHNARTGFSPVEAWGTPASAEIGSSQQPYFEVSSGTIKR